MPEKPSPDPKSFPIDTYPEPISPPESIKPKNIDELPLGYAELAALHSATTRLNATLEWEPLLKETLDAAIQLARADDGVLMMVDDVSDDLYVAAAPNFPDAVAARTRIKPDEGAVGLVARQLGLLLLTSRAQIAECPAFLPKDQLTSVLCAPLHHPCACDEPEMLGILILIRRVGSPDLTHDDARLIREFCAPASAALQNARCYRKMQRRAVQLKNFVEISQSLMASLQVDVVLRSIIDRAVELLGCQAGSLLMVDPETSELVFKVVVGPAESKLIGTRLPPGAGIAGAVAQTGAPLIVNHAKADPRHYGEVDASTALTTQALLCVPLMDTSRAIGVVEVMNKTSGVPFDEEDRDLLAAFALQGAIALKNAQLYTDLRNTFADTVRLIANAVEARDQYTRGHTGRVTQLAIETARELGWSREQIEILEIGALLHDIGKIGISDAILRKPDDLTPDEYKEMMRHPVVGAKMLEGVAALRPMLPYILYHQERYDGLGYPFGLRGNEIPLEGRILAAIDTFDAMTSNRPYRNGLSEEEAIAEIMRNRGTQFDPDVVDALLRALQSRKANG